MIITRPNKATNKFLAVLPERSADVIIRRFGLGDDSKRVTLEAIGRDYGITRERVRQIENNAIKNIKKSETFNKEEKIFEELKSAIDVLGGIVAEMDLLKTLAKNEKEQNQIHFLLTLGDAFTKEKENNNFKTRWHIDRDLSNQIHILLDEIHNQLNENDLYPEEDIIALFVDRAGNILAKYKNPETVKKWLSISKVIGKNHFNEWGLSSSNNINAKGIRDYAYLSIRQHGSPMHFTEVAKSIENNFGKKAHIATCHNELIKDPRFVLVGRGLYALSEWGYTGGVVRDVIKSILEKEGGALTREDIVDKVLRERYIKENTVVVNLQDPRHFKRDTKGRYLAV
ncbi:hypothetical protein KKG48_01370 [Patescibacteria group bacterium]|nr:hypothetical protein [Patescibacteria group bacterium]MCG2694513.1 hypothetical protein [Candidatus Parcubacteria bacterium]